MHPVQPSDLDLLSALPPSPPWRQRHSLVAAGFGPLSSARLARSPSPSRLPQPPRLCPSLKALLFASRSAFLSTHPCPSPLTPPACSTPSRGDHTQTRSMGLLWSLLSRPPRVCNPSPAFSCLPCRPPFSHSLAPVTPRLAHQSLCLLRCFVILVFSPCLTSSPFLTRRTCPSLAPCVLLPLVRLLSRLARPRTPPLSPTVRPCITIVTLARLPRSGVPRFHRSFQAQHPHPAAPIADLIRAF